MPKYDFDLIDSLVTDKLNHQRVQSKANEVRLSAIRPRNGGVERGTQSLASQS